MQVDIFGSCVCRDIFRQEGGRKYKIGRCISSVPITTLYGVSLPLKDETIDKLAISDYERRMLKIQVKQNAVDLLKQSESQILIMDLAEELMKRIRLDTGKGYEMAYQEESKAYLEELLKGDIFSPRDMKLEEIDKRFRKFAKDIVFHEDNQTGYLEKNICVIESYYTEKITREDGLLHLHDESFKVKECNEWLKKLYAMLYKNLPDCKVIRFPQFTHSSENHIRGESPLGYTRETYDYFIDVLDVLCGKSKINTIENLYREQSLKNRLYTRVLQSTEIWHIKGMRKEIQAMKEEMATLKKQVKDH